MKKKVIAILLCGAMVAVLGSGCGSDSSSESNATDTSSKAESASGGTSTGSASDSSAGAEKKSSSGGDTYTLTVQSHDPENSATGQFLNDWADAVNEASDGQLDVQVYHGGTLGGAKDTLDLLRNGSCDIGWGLQSFFPDVFPVTEVFMLPMIPIEKATQGSEAIWDFYNTTDYMDDEYADYHVLLLHTNCQSPIATVSEEIEAISDMQGMQLRGNAGPPTTFIQDLGANPVSVAINDLYSNLDKGTLDGCITDWHAISAFSLDETLSWYMDENIGVSTYFLLMNQDVYDSLPGDLQNILDEQSEKAIQYTTAWDDVEDEMKETVDEEGKLYNLSDDERANLEEVADQTTEEWISSMNDNGYDGQAIYDDAMQCIEDAK